MVFVSKKRIVCYVLIIALTLTALISCDRTTEQPATPTQSVSFPSVAPPVTDEPEAVPSTSASPLATPSASASPAATPVPPEQKSDMISYIYTLKRSFAITFSGMADKDTTEAILNALDKYNMKALFYLQGDKVTAQPEIAKEILNRGHEIGNDGTRGADLTLLDYTAINDQIKGGNQAIQQQLGAAPKYLWNMGGKCSDDILKAAYANNITFVKYTINLESLKKDTDAQIQSYLENKITRGGVLSLGTSDVKYDLKCIGLFAKVAKEMNYSVMPLDYLLDNTYERKPLEDIPGWDAAKVNPKYQGIKYEAVRNGSPDKKTVVLSFDDWGGDYSVTRLLDILDKYNIKASFFLRGNGVEVNPNLAMAISQDGMDVCNHTYSHPDLTKLSPEEAQQEIVHCHQVLTEAIQRQPDMLVRPPYGSLNDATAQVIAATGYKDIAMYSVSAEDWDIADHHNTSYITKYINQHTTSGSIILLHLMIELDTYKALPQIIEYLKGKGYTFEKMSQLIASGDAVPVANVNDLQASE